MQIMCARHCIYNMREYGFSLTCVLRISRESQILSLYGRIRVSEKPYSRIFYVVRGLTHVNVNIKLTFHRNRYTYLKVPRYKCLNSIFDWMTTIQFLLNRFGFGWGWLLPADTRFIFIKLYINKMKL